MSRMSLPSCDCCGADIPVAPRWAAHRGMSACACPRLPAMMADTLADRCPVCHKCPRHCPCPPAARVARLVEMARLEIELHYGEGWATFVQATLDHLYPDARKEGFHAP